jgi:hypothetical protein
LFGAARLLRFAGERFFAGSAKFSLDGFALLLQAKSGLSLIYLSNSKIIQKQA